jgi:hypothetical protein
MDIVRFFKWLFCIADNKYNYGFSFVFTDNFIFINDFECCICMEVYENGDVLYVLPCDHVYHEKCVYQWFSISNTCPICKHIYD